MEKNEIRRRVLRCRSLWQRCDLHCRFAVAVAAVVDVIVEVECNYSALPRAISLLISGVSKRCFTANKVNLAEGMVCYYHLVNQSVSS